MCVCIQIVDDHLKLIKYTDFIELNAHEVIDGDAWRKDILQWAQLYPKHIQLAACARAHIDRSLGVYKYGRWHNKRRQARTRKKLRREFNSLNASKAFLHLFRLRTMRIAFICSIVYGCEHIGFWAHLRQSKRRIASDLFRSFNWVGWYVHSFRIRVDSHDSIL